MNTVEPLRETALLDTFYDIARAHDKRAKKNEVSWYLMLLLGFNTALRISDLRKLKVKDVFNRPTIYTRAQKTGKEDVTQLTPFVRREIKRLLAGKSPEEYILHTRQRDINGEYKPLSRQRAYQIINDIARVAGVTDKTGCHTMRKTYGYMYYMHYKDETELQQILHHSSPAITKRYIGILQDQINQHREAFTGAEPTRKTARG